MIKHNIEYENEIKRLISEYPVHFTRMLESKGKHKNRAKDRTYLLNYINTCTPKLNSPFYTTLTKLYWIFNDIEDFPKCANPNCQNKMVNFNVKNLKDGYIKYCSRECQYSDKNWKESVENGVKLKYGVKNYFMTDVFKKTQSKFQKDIQEKKYQTRKRNNSFKESEKENDVYRLLLQKYKKTDIKRQYNDKNRYPFNCDFYIESIDTFIEYNGSWTHGGHPFNEQNDEDQKLITIWKNKNTKFYNNAIETWTIRDVKKRNTALKNKLNYYEFWNLGEVRRFVGIIGLLQINNLDIPWNRKRIEYEFEYFKKRNIDGLQKPTSKNNYIIKYFQQDIFFNKEKDLWKNDEKIREKLIANRIKYLNKKEDELTVDDILTGFKKSGIYYGYSHFNPLWFKWFLTANNIQTCYDPCGGWGHRLLGALNIQTYIYNDLSKSTKENVDKMIEYFKLKNVKTYNNDASTFIPEENFEAIFTCPPYYNVEEYECGKFESKKLFDNFLKSLFDIFYKKETCKIFGIVIREDLMIFDNYNEKHSLNENDEKYLHNKRNNFKEYLYVFRK